MDKHLLNRREFNRRGVAFASTLSSAGTMIMALSTRPARAATRTVKLHDGTIVPALDQGSAGLGQGRRPEAAEEEALELCAEVGDGLTGRRRRIVGVFEPPLLQQRSDTPCPMLTSSSCFNQGRSPIRSPRCCATGRARYWLRRSRQRWRSFSPSISISRPRPA